MVAVLRQRNFALLWFAGLISVTGNWTLNIALPYYIYQLTSSTLAAGLMFMVRILPGVLFGSFAGVLVDHWNRKWTMVGCNLFATILVLLLLTVKSTQWLWVVYLVAFVESSVAQLFAPAERALLPHLVTGNQLVTANSVGALNVSLGMLIGPAIGGALIDMGSLSGVVIFDSLSYFIAGVMISLINWKRDSEFPKVEITEVITGWRRIGTDWVSGLKLVKQNHPITIVFVAAAIAMLGEGMIQVLLVPFVELLQGGAMEFGWMLTLRALGGLLGGLFFGHLGSALKPQTLFPWTLLGMGVLLLVMVNCPVFLLSLVFLCVVGVLAVGASVTSTAIFQNEVSDTYLGRTFGTFGMIAALMTLAGQGFAGAFAEQLGVAVLLNIGGSLYLLSGLISTLIPRIYGRSNED